MTPEIGAGAVIVALVLAGYGSAAAAAGAATGRSSLVVSAQHAALGVFALVTGALVLLDPCLPDVRFLHPLRGHEHEPRHAVLLPDHRGVGSPGGLDRPLGVDARPLHADRGAAPPPERPRAVSLGSRRHARRARLLSPRDGRAGARLSAVDPGASRWARTQSAPRGHRDDHPPGLPLSRLHGLHRPLRLRRGRAGHRARGRHVDRPHPALDLDRVVLPLARSPHRRLVELPRAGLGRVLGVGSRRKRGLHALAHRHGVPALGDDPGAAAHAQALEHLPGRPDLQPHALRNLPHALRRHRLRPRVHPGEHRRLLPRVSRPGGAGLPRPHRLALGRPSRRGRAGLRGLARVGLPAQQRVPGGRRLHGLLRHGVSAARRGRAGREGQRGGPVLQPGQSAALPRPDLPDGRGAAHRVAPRLPRQPQAQLRGPRAPGQHRGRLSSGWWAPRPP